MKDCSVMRNSNDDISIMYCFELYSIETELPLPNDKIYVFLFQLHDENRSERDRQMRQILVLV